MSDLVLPLEREIVEAYVLNDETFAQITSRLGCTSWKIDQTLKRYGISRRSIGVRKGHKFTNRKLGHWTYDPEKPTEIERRRKISETLKGHEVSRETRDKISHILLTKEGASNRGKKIAPQSEETKEKLRQATLRAFSEGRLVPTGYRGKGTWYKGIRMRSGLEAEFARQLDEAELEWQYEPRRFRLSWCTYTPDFYLPELDIWVETKGWMDEVSKRKVESFRRETRKTLSVVWYEEVFS